MGLFGAFGNREDDIIDGTMEAIGSAGRGFDAAVGNIVSDPNLKTVSEFARDFTIEALPGAQRTGLDQSYGEGLIKKGVDLRDTGVLNTAIKQNTQKQAGNLRETVAEKTLGTGLRKAGEVITKRIPQIIGRTTAGTAGSGGLLALPMGIWAAADTIDTGVAAATGKGIADWAADPEEIRGRSGAQRAIQEEREMRDQMQSDQERPFGTESVLNGEPVMWGGRDYGWQSPESFRTIRR